MLEKGCVYIVPLMERLALPADISGTANPKSSTGRLDVFTRLITDDAVMFDQVPRATRDRSTPRSRRAPSASSSARARGSASSACSSGNLSASDSAIRRASSRNAAGELARPERKTSTMGSRSPWISRATARRVDRLPGAALHRPDRPRQGGPLRRRAVLGAGPRGRPRQRHPQPRRLLHPGLQGGGHGAARSRRRDARPTTPASASSGCTTPASSIPASATPPPAGPDRGRFWKSARSRCRSCCATGNWSARLVYERLTAVPDKLYGVDIGSSYQRQGLALAKQFKRR